MESKLAVKMCRKFVNLGIISNQHEDVYVYGLELILSFSFSTLVILLTGILLHQIDTAIVFLIIFITLRRYTGGYHAPTYFRCKITTISLYAIVAILSVYLDISLIAYLPLIITGLYIILRYGPIENIYKPLTDKVKQNNKRLATLLFLVLAIGGSVSKIMYQKLCNAVFYTLGIVIVLMIIPMLKKGEVNHEENC